MPIDRLLYPDSSISFTQHSIWLVQFRDKHNVFNWIKNINLLLGILFPIFFNIFYSTATIEKVRSTSFPIPVITWKDDPNGYFDWAQFINEGIDLIHKHDELNGKRTVPLGVSDYFSYSLLRPPPIHLPVWMCFGNDLGDTVYAADEYLFSDADAIMVPLKPGKEINMFGRIKAYQDYIHLHYEKVDQSGQWMLWERKAE